AREDQAERVAFADQPGQPLRAPIARGDAELDLGLAELGGVARDPQVARHGELAAAAQRIAVHRRDHRLAAGLEPPQHRLAAQRPCLPVERPLFREVSDVRPGHDRLPRSPAFGRSRPYRTNTLPDPLFPSLDAVTSANPAPTARTSTVWPNAPSIRATEESLTVHDTARPERMFPLASRRVAKKLAL